MPVTRVPKLPEQFGIFAPAQLEALRTARPDPQPVAVQHHTPVTVSNDTIIKVITFNSKTPT